MKVSALFAIFLAHIVSGFAPSTFSANLRLSTTTRSSVILGISSPKNGCEENEKSMNTMVRATTLACLLGVFGISDPVLADELGRETEALTLYTGENVEICMKRGPLGACKKTETRTEENDNDKAKKYFKDPELAYKDKLKSLSKLQVSDPSSEGNELIEALKQRTIDNKDKNDLIVRQVTLQNDLGASFGPFSRQVVIMNSDGINYTVLDGAQAMRLKGAGYIKGRKFVTQPTQQAIDDALEAPEGGIGGFFQGISKKLFSETE